jgi:uncharacterized protein YdeI (YjbR/CyaY-like superfamily)
MKMKKNTEYEILAFASQEDWDAWLEHNHTVSPGVWLRLAKKASGIASVTYAEAVETALCYGWIDGLKRPFDEREWLQKFTPRNPKSVWSKINRDKADALIASGRMHPAGLAMVEAAKRNGRWTAAYDPQSAATVPPDLQAALDTHTKAAAFFATLTGASRYSILYRIQTAKKAETRARRLEEVMAALKKGEKPYR